MNNRIRFFAVDGERLHPLFMASDMIPAFWLTLFEPVDWHGSSVMIDKTPLWLMDSPAVFGCGLMVPVEIGLERALERRAIWRQWLPAVAPLYEAWLDDLAQAVRRHRARALQIDLTRWAWLVGSEDDARDALAEWLEAWHVPLTASGGGFRRFMRGLLYGWDSDYPQAFPEALRVLLDQCGYTFVSAGDALLQSSDDGWPMLPHTRPVLTGWPEEPVRWLPQKRDFPELMNLMESSGA